MSENIGHCGDSKYSNSSEKCEEPIAVVKDSINESKPKHIPRYVWPTDVDYNDATP